jgi:hypothetical protein
MLGFVLALHQAMVWLILLAAAVALVIGVVWLYLTGALAELAQMAQRALRRQTIGRTVLAPGRVAPATIDRVRQLFRYALAVVAGFGVLQAILGGALFLFFHCRAGEQLHYVYGLIVLLAIPVAYAYSDQRQVRRDIIIMTIAVVAILGAALRAFSTGPGGICH